MTGRVAMLSMSLKITSNLLVLDYRKCLSMKDYIRYQCLVDVALVQRIEAFLPCTNGRILSQAPLSWRLRAWQSLSAQDVGS